MSEQTTETAGGKAGSLGAWSETIATIRRLCGQYHYSRVRMLYYAVKAFNDLSALNQHRLHLPVDFNDPLLKTKPDTAPMILHEMPRAERESTRSAGDSKTRRPTRPATARG